MCIYVQNMFTTFEKSACSHIQTQINMLNMLLEYAFIKYSYAGFMFDLLCM